MKPAREVTLDPARQLWALSATARGMQGHSFARAARQAFDELMDAVGRAGLRGQVRSVLALSPDEPQGPDDPDARYQAAVVFGHDLARGEGQCHRPELALSGTLAWVALSPGRYAVFDHVGPYEGLHRRWRAIYEGWLPFSGEQLRTVPALELCINRPDTTPPDKLHTEIWLPLHRR